ncbi:dTDP-4-dehydrorhamnose 3,5-epimerase [Oceanospirillum multiglobuliferum]|uniref:dTDP-4-dehydrorhamnose 3,5-epimerase n=1 Tax=Oceanospirillum multiglobuliferum TaxID=64969 RepID=A0A1T4S8S4_9GAMM|nr:dTDP-4-dehydrorhamnose 3,5-epimerase [Oceanospirillum multiglobuliferum]OPX54382.1 dTDP-4-dehydrorhamnose 3,5-epimerase [Oceanospirillum multiglobuliferum]SKA24629.1 dTDP-4-dehydrorhamnose 3,5-epimerase [Oceanospirillum multiglobuliferum]
MKVIDTPLAGVKIIEPKVFGDQRGFFKETFSVQRYQALAGIDLEFVQDNHSRSRRGVLRGLHFQKTKPQGKLVSVLSGAVFDVAADINPESPTYGQYVGVELSGENHRQLWVPPGYAHGFCVLSDEVDFIYKCTDYYDPSDEGGVAWDCSLLAIDWPVTEPQLSEKDRLYPGLKALHG